MSRACFTNNRHSHVRVCYFCFFLLVVTRLGTFVLNEQASVNKCLSGYGLGQEYFRFRSGCWLFPLPLSFCLPLSLPPSVSILKYYIDIVMVITQFINLMRFESTCQTLKSYPKHQKRKKNTKMSDWDLSLAAKHWTDTSNLQKLKTTADEVRGILPLSRYKAVPNNWLRLVLLSNSEQVQTFPNCRSPCPTSVTYLIVLIECCQFHSGKRQC